MSENARHYAPDLAEPERPAQAAFGGFISAPQESDIAAGAGSVRELARRVYVAVASFRANVSYVTMDKRLEASGNRIDPAWEFVAQRLLEAVDESVSERLLRAFGK